MILSIKQVFQPFCRRDTWWSGSFAESSYTANSITGGAAGCYYIGGYPLSCDTNGNSGNDGAVTITWRG